MKVKNTLILATLISTSSFCQEKNMQIYDSLVQIAYAKYKTNEFAESANYFSNAFKSNNWKARLDDRYNAACSWALSNNKDSSFYQLNYLTYNFKFSNLEHLTNDKDLLILQTDKRWKKLVKNVKSNQKQLEKDFDQKIVKKLKKIDIDDQTERIKSGEIEEKYGVNSPQMDSMWRIINKKDSINQIYVTKLLDKKGWLGPEKIGYDGVNTIFLVIQHAPLQTQQKYISMMRQATKENKLDPASLALLEDRVALGEGKLQVYGSQLRYDEKNKTYYLEPCADPDNLDKRRAEVGLGPISEYLGYFGLTWNLEEYKKNLPYYLELMRK